MAKERTDGGFVPVKTEDIVLRTKKGEDVADVYVCAIANDEIFVLAKPRVNLLADGGVEIIGYYPENCKVYDNNAKTMGKHGFSIA